MTAKADFFARVRNEIRKAAALFPASVAERSAYPRQLADAVRREIAERWPTTLERFQQEFERVGGTFYRVARLAQVPALVAGIAREREARRLVTWYPTGFGLDLTPDFRAQALDVEVMPVAAVEDPERRRQFRMSVAAADIGFTGVDLAVAETGTLVLRSGAGRPRSTALLPPYHVAVFDRTALVESLAQLGVFLEAWHNGDPEPGGGAAIHFITGPSRTADIELTLTRGVHGPKEVHAIFVDAPFHG
jgi:L-lactate dehydrogenase complex protein LldG